MPGELTYKGSAIALEVSAATQRFRDALREEDLEDVLSIGLFRLWNNRDRYYNDDYYFAQPNYRYYYDNDYYYINRYQADLIRQALNYGYQEGFRAGRADHYDHWGYDYRSNYIYQDADYGYYGYYVREDEYNHYFREGFQRGYEDGYYSRSRYGRYDRGSYNLLGSVLESVFRLELLR